VGREKFRMIFQAPLFYESIEDSRFRTRQEAGLLQAEADEHGHDLRGHIFGDEQDRREVRGQG
jgi:hypothetical protein